MGLKFAEDYFDQIDCDIKAYWLGFIFADGGITKNKLRFSLAEKDLSQLVLLCSELNIPNKLIKQINRKLGNKIYKTCDVVINSKKLTSSLIRLGCTERKTLTIRFPSIDTKFNKAFLIGYYDGDGCQGTSTICCGNKSFLEDVRRIFNIPYEVKLKTNPYGQCYILNLGRPFLRSCFEEFDYNYGLVRKRMFRDYKNGEYRDKHFSEEPQNTQPRRKSLTCPYSKDELQQMLIRDTITDISKRIGRNPKTIRKWCCDMAVIVPSSKQRNIANRRFEISKNDLKKMINHMSFCDIARQFGVSDNAIRKRAKLLGVEKTRCS